MHNEDLYVYLFFLSSFLTDLPKFGEPLQNLTIPVGREALLSCVVDNLQTYKVIGIHFFDWVQTGDYAIPHSWFEVRETAVAAVK